MKQKKFFLKLKKYYLAFIYKYFFYYKDMIIYNKNE